MEHSEKLDVVKGGGGRWKSGRKFKHEREKIVYKFAFDSVYLSIFYHFWYVVLFRFGSVVFLVLACRWKLEQV